MVDTSYALRSYISFHTLLKRELIRIFRLSVQTLLGPLISNLLFLGIFAGMFAGRTVTVEGVSYLQFITPGLIFSAATLSGFQNPLFSVMILKYQDTIRDFALFPLPDLGRMTAFALAGGIRGVMVGAATWLAAGVFVGFDIYMPVAFWVFIFTVALIVSLGGYMTGMLFDSMEKTNFIVSLVLTPLIYLSGIFFEVRSLPGVWRTIAAHNPLAVLTGLTRSLYLENYPAPSEPLQIVSLMFFFVSIVGGGWYVTQKGIGIVRR